MMIKKCAASLRSLLAAGIFLMCILNSCKENFFSFEVDCEECYQEKPSLGDLKVTFSSGYVKQGIPYILYEGKIEDNKILMIDTCYKEILYIEVPVDTEYSIKAQYPSKGRYFYVIDGTKLMVKRVSAECDVTCWVYADENINAEIKYPKLLE